MMKSGRRIRLTRPKEEAFIDLEEPVAKAIAPLEERIKVLERELVVTNDSLRFVIDALWHITNYASLTTTSSDSTAYKLEELAYNIATVCNTAIAEIEKVHPEGDFYVRRWLTNPMPPTSDAEPEDPHITNISDM